MKKVLLSALSVFAIGATMNAQVAQMPMIEHFTQASCGPCASQNPTLYTTLGNFGSANYVKMTYQTSWPGVDPMNAEYPAGPNDRRNYYGVTGVPNATLNGGTTGAPNTIVTTNTLNAAAAQMTPYEMEITHTWGTGSTITVDVVVRNVTASAVATADRIHFAMVEEHISFATAPGSNGETDFYNVVRDMYNVSTGASSTAGTTIGSIPAMDSLTFTFNVTPPSYIRDLNQVSFAGYLQNNSSKTTYQAAKSSAGNVPGLISAAATANSTVGAGYCDYAFTPAINFTNTGAITITDLTAEYSINGGTPIPVTLSGLTLTNGQSTPINFTATSLVPGTSLVSYEITDINNGGTYSAGPVSMADEVYSKLTATGTAAPVMEGLESAPLTTGTGYSRTLTTGIFDAPASVGEPNFSILDGPTYNYGAIGGMAASNRSIRFRFFSLSGQEQLKLVMQKVNFATGSQLTFNTAYRQYQSENDRLEVLVSTDCGATWTNVFNEAGATLAHGLAASTTQFVPSDPLVAGEWFAHTVNLSAYDNMNDVIVMFRGTSAYGNNLFLDDINLTNATNVVNVDKKAADMRIMPNPVTDHMTVEFTMVENADANISIINALGQNVQNVTNGSFQGTNTIEVNTSNLASGVYFLNITSNNATSTKRFVVE